MKNIILAVTVTLAIFASSDIFARGFSVGVLGSYAIDNGAIDKSIEKDATMNFVSGSEKTDYKSIKIAGVTLFARYDFKNNLFLRTGFESNFTISAGNYKYDNGGGINEEFIYKYKSYTIPLYLGITLSPDRGRTSVYGAAGINYSKIEIERERLYTTPNENKFDSDSDLIGLGGIFGLERILFSNIYLVIEYSLYAVSNENKEKYIDAFSTEFEYIERYSLPTQQLRVGLKYDF